MELLLYGVIGCLAGFLAGLLGVGGGLVIVPALFAIYLTFDFPSAHLMHVALGTSLTSIIFTSLSSVWAHHREKAVFWDAVKQLTPGILLGAFVGAWVAKFLPTQPLQWIFAAFECFVATQMLLNIKPNPQRELPGRAGMFGVGNVIGGVSSVVGIGGGTLTVPFLVWCNVAIKKSIATSAACGLPIAIAGGFGYLMAGYSVEQLPDNTIGFIHLPSLLGIVSASVLVAPLGAKAAHLLPANRLKQIFACLLYIIAIYMFFA